MNEKIILITGTKGKTTVSNLVDEILLRLNTGKETLRVDTTGHFVNGKRCSSNKLSLELYELAPTICHGRYLFSLSLFGPERLKNTVAILEASHISGKTCGTGVKCCDVGIWTNIFELLKANA